MYVFTQDHIDLTPPPLKLMRLKLGDQKIQELVNSRHLPNQDPLEQLLYLTTLKLNGNKSLFTLSEKTAMENSKKASLRTRNWLYGGIAVTNLILAYPIFSTLPQNPWVFAAVGTVIGITTNTVSYLATGFFPDASSRADDKRLVATFEVKSRYKEMAYTLMDLYFSIEEEEHRLAKSIVNHLDCEEIRKKMGGELHDPAFSEFITKKFNMIIQGLNGTTPNHPFLRDYLSKKKIIII